MQTITEADGAKKELRPRYPHSTLSLSPNYANGPELNGRQNHRPFLDEKDPVRATTVTVEE